ncbi:MAG: AAA family ATPase [Paludibacter sp.]|nr:AAA family ATPase [Paludibacter sp.]
MSQQNNIILKQGQQLALDKLKAFIKNPKSKIFILKGFAGTGKTTMLRVLIEELQRQELRFSLLASTGRAAKIVSNIANCEAKTVHGLIYSFQELNQDIEQLVADRKSSGVDKSGQLLLNFELITVNTEAEDRRIYIVDEASMVSDKADPNAIQAIFGSGKLLCDLLNYDKNGKFIFVGDECQLPPVTQNFSPALSANYIANQYQLRVDEMSLTEIVRQGADNDIILASKKMRELFHNPPDIKWAKFPLRGHKNIKMYPDQASLISNYVKSLQQAGYNETTFICFSNRTCDIMTNIIRPMLGISSNTLQKNDLLLVTQNNYISGLMNGDLVRVESVGMREKRAGLTFVKVEVRELFTNKVYAQLLIENVVYNHQTNLSQAEQKELFVDYFLRMRAKEIGQKNPLFNKYMMIDPYLNALRAVYGYALTCHKSQGGEWNHVYLDIAKNVPAIEKPYVYQWIYTAMTRARVQLHIVDSWWVS